MSGIIGVSPNMRSGRLGKFPAGMLVQSKVLHTETGGSSLGSSSGNFDSVVGGSFTTKYASSDSMLRIWWETNQVHNQENQGLFDMTLRKGSSDTSHAAVDSMHNTSVKPRMYIYGNSGGGYSSWSLFAVYPFVSGTHLDSTAYVSAITSWSAGETLYWRLFQKQDDGSGMIFAYLLNGRMEIRLEEITI